MRTRAAGIFGFFLGCSACGGDAEKRPQLVVVVDTNAPLLAETAPDSAVSLSATVDTVRVDLLDVAGQPIDFLDVVAPERADWPISFGVAREDAPRVTFRVRAFSGALAGTGTLSGRTTIEPIPEATIDRLVELELPDAGIRTVRVTLDGDCWNRVPVFVAPRLTCVGAALPEADPTLGVEVLDGAPAATPPGTWQSATAVPCEGAAPNGATCIAGGFSLLGDLSTGGFDPVTIASSKPLVPALVTRFWLDTTEYTVGRFRELVLAGRFTGQLPYPANPADDTRAFCTWRGAADATNDAYPLNCITWNAARLACQSDGGDLPTEAQWEHAARGRGELRRFPWGNAESNCCIASVSRRSIFATAALCEGTGPEPVGSHPLSAACNGLGDVSRDLVLDLGGSLAEFTRDSFQDFSGACWKRPGIALDPLCADAGVGSHIMRGGEWSAGPGIAFSALRRRALSIESSSVLGFRCAYRDEP
jgi:formylglycine-generating enzyme required for sulfatase activity